MKSFEPNLFRPALSIALLPKCNNKHIVFSVAVVVAVAVAVVLLHILLPSFAVSCIGSQAEG